MFVAKRMWVGVNVFHLHGGLWEVSTAGPCSSVFLPTHFWIPGLLRFDIYTIRCDQSAADTDLDLMLRHFSIIHYAIMLT